MTKIELRVEHDDCGGRLDVWLASRLDGVSRARIQSLIKSGSIRFAGGGTTRANIRTTEGMKLVVELPDPESTDVVPEDIPLDIIHEDSDIIVVNKPAGLVVHPAPGHRSGTLVNALLFHCHDLGGIGGEVRPGIVHRLDRDTSGVMVVAKNQSAMDILTSMFREREIDKEYVAIIHGVPHPGVGRIETEIGRSSHDRKKMSVHPSSGGRDAVTNYRVVEVLGDYSLIRVVIETGRTHQIRVHMAHIGHHIVGDKVYGKKKSGRLPTVGAGRQMLHARKLAFRHPHGGDRVEFEAELPDDMNELLDALRGQSA
jgi:23S rRNA pseudouridine1911/1915/1917 synthase